MKSILFVLIFSVCYQSLHSQDNSDPYANSNSVKTQYNDCQSRLKQLNRNIDSINDLYNKSVQDYKQGLFCSKCHRSKTDLERSGIDFWQHLKDVGGHPVPATQADFDTLNNNYLNSYNNAKQSYESASSECGNLYNQYVNTKNQDYQNQLNQQREVQAQKQQRAQDDLNKSNNEILMELQEKQDKANQLNILNINDPSYQAKALLNANKNVESSIFTDLNSYKTSDNSLVGSIENGIKNLMNDYNATGASDYNYGNQNLGTVLDYTPSADNSNGVNPDRSADALNDNRISRVSDALYPHPYIYREGQDANEALNEAFEGNQHAFNDYQQAYTDNTANMLATWTGTGFITAGIFLAAPAVGVVGAAVGGYVIYKMIAPNVSKVIFSIMDYYRQNNTQNDNQ